MQKFKVVKTWEIHAENVSKAILKTKTWVHFDTSTTKVSEIGYQVLNKGGFPASNDFNWMCIFPSPEEALIWIKYIKEECDVDITGFVIRKVEVKSCEGAQVTDQMLDSVTIPDKSKVPLYEQWEDLLRTM